MRALLLLAILLAGTGCERVGHPVETETEELPNGFYLVTWWGANLEEAPSPKDNERLLEYEYQFLDPSSDRPHEYVLVDTLQRVPLLLSEAPEAIPHDEDRLMLRLKLTPDSAEILADLTRDNVGRNVTIIIGGEVISTHTIRSVIEDGNIQISRCSDNACKFILAKLTE